VTKADASDPGRDPDAKPEADPEPVSADPTPRAGAGFEAFYEPWRNPAKAQGNVFFLHGEPNHASLEERRQAIREGAAQFAADSAEMAKAAEARRNAAAAPQSTSSPPPSASASPPAARPSPARLAPDIFEMARRAFVEARGEAAKYESVYLAIAAGETVGADRMRAEIRRASAELLEASATGRLRRITGVEGAAAKALLAELAARLGLDLKREKA
jgi:hypothetical protein